MPKRAKMTDVKSRFFLLFALLFLAPLARAEVITRFDCDLHLNADTSLDVVETIVFDPQGSSRHGIFRIIPVVYSRNGGKYTIYLNVLSVTNENGQNWAYSQTRQGRDINLKIGDADKYLNGPATFKIHYLVRRAVNFFDGAPEVYWNATGNEWPFAIETATARFFPPPGVSPEQVQTKSFVGPPGGQNPANVQVNSDSILFYYQNMPPSDGLTFVAGLPANSVTKPTALQTFLWFFADWWPAFVLPVLTGCLITFLWSTSGRDVEGNLPAQVEWSPPKDLTPAEVGTLIDERCDMADIISTLIDLAARGYLTIEQVQTQNFLFFQSRDYRFHRVNRVHNPEEPPLKPHEQEFLRGLFGSTTAMGTVSLSSLKNNFYTHLPVMETSIYQSLTNKHLFTANPETTRQTYRGIGFALLVLGAIAAFFGNNQTFKNLDTLFAAFFDALVNLNGISSLKIRQFFKLAIF